MTTDTIYVIISKGRWSPRIARTTKKFPFNLKVGEVACRLDIKMPDNIVEGPRVTVHVTLDNVIKPT